MARAASYPAGRMVMVDDTDVMSCNTRRQRQGEGRRVASIYMVDGREGCHAIVRGEGSGHLASARCSGVLF